MKKVTTTILLILVVVAAAAAWWLWGQGSNTAGQGAAAPQAGVADIPMDWFLTEGELALGNENIRTPQGVNVLLKVDSDDADHLFIKGLNVQKDLLPDQVTEIYFNAHKLGHFEIMLKSTGSKIGSLEIYQPAP